MDEFTCLVIGFWFGLWSGRIAEVLKWRRVRRGAIWVPQRGWPLIPGGTPTQTNTELGDGGNG